MSGPRAAACLLSLIIPHLAAGAPAGSSNILVKDGEKVLFCGDSITAFGC